MLFLFSFVFWVAAFLFNSFNMIRNHSSDISTFSFVERGLSPVCFLFGNRGFPFLFFKKRYIVTRFNDYGWEENYPVLLSI